MAKMPVNVVATNRGCVRRRMVRPGTYDATCSQNTPRKKSRKESNISVKKYHHNPTLGVRSGRSSRTPYVASKKSQEPESWADASSNAPLAASKPTVCTAVKTMGLGAVLALSVRASYNNTSSGGNRRIGCIARYDAADIASRKVVLAPWQALAMAVRMKRLVKVEVERAMQVASVNGLNKKLSTISACPKTYASGRWHTLLQWQRYSTASPGVER